jgi:hypothetical protein
MTIIERVRLNALQLFTSCTPIWSGKVCTPIFLEREAVHSKIFGVDNFPLQNFPLPWSKQSCTHSSLQKFGVHLKSTPKVLECTSSPLQNCWCTSSPLQKIWSALKVHSKEIGVYNIPLQKCQNFGVHNCPLQFFWSGQLFTPFFLEWTLAHSKMLECM